MDQPSENYIRVRDRKSEDGGSRDLSYPELPEPLGVGTYDNHTHLEIADGENPMDYREHLELSNQVGILGGVQVGGSVETSRWSAKIAAIEPRLLAAVALHPNVAAEYASIAELDLADVIGALNDLFYVIRVSDETRYAAQSHQNSLLGRLSTRH